LNEIFGGPPKIARQRRALLSDFADRAPEEWWAGMDEVFHLD